MATISMTSTFKVCPEGVHIFRIYNVDYDPNFGKLVVYMVNAQGITHTERFNLMNNNGSPNEKACASFSYFAKTALNNFGLEEIDHTDIINRFIKAEITHSVLPSTKDPNSTVTFANIGNKWVADNFDTTPCKKALEIGTTPAAPKTAPVQTESKGVDLNSLLD